MTTRPMRIRQSRASFAVIQRDHNCNRQWLVQWNHAWMAYNLVGGHKRAEESYRQCLVRELREELDLRPDRDYTVDSAPAGRLRFTAFSARAHELTRYEMGLFRVRLSAEAEQRVNGNSANRWLTDEEILDQQTHDGQPVSETVSRLLDCLGVFGAQDPS